MRHATLSLAFALTAASVATTQIGRVGWPPVVGADRLSPSWAGVAEIHDIEVERIDAFRLEVYLSARRTPGADLDLIGGVWDLTTGAFSEVSGLGLDVTWTAADESGVTVSSDRRTLVYDTPSGPVLLKRGRTTDPFGDPTPLNAALFTGPVGGTILDAEGSAGQCYCYPGWNGLWVTDLDPSAATPVTSAGVLLLDGAGPHCAAGLIDVRPAPAGAPTGRNRYGIVYRFDVSGKILERILVCITQPCAETEQLAPAAPYASLGFEPTGGCQLGGTQFWCDAETGGVELLHLVDTAAVTLRDGTSNTFALPVLAPVPGTPGAPPSAGASSAFLILGDRLPAPVQVGAIGGTLAVNPRIVLGPIANTTGRCEFPLQVPALPAGLRIETQSMFYDKSSPYIALSATGFVAVAP